MLSAPPSAAFALHHLALAACKALHGAEYTLATLLARIHDQKLHHDLGYANVVDYAEALLQLTRKKAEGLLRLGRSLPRLTVLDRRWAAGEVAWSKAREMLRVLTPDNEAAWLDRAARVSNRQLEDDLVGTLMGELPPSHVGPPKEPARKKVVFVMDTVDAETVKAVLQHARATIGADRDDVGDGELLAAILTRVMHDVAKEEAPTGERYRIVVQHCPECGRTSGQHADLTDTTVLAAQCDAQVLEMREGPKRGRLSHTIPPAVRRAVLQRDGGQCRVPGCTNKLHVDCHHVIHREHGGAHTEDNLLTLCGVHHKLVHDGRLAVEHRPGGGFAVTFPDGRRFEVGVPVVTH